MVSQMLHGGRGIPHVLNGFTVHSSLPYHITVKAGRRPEQGYATNFHTGTKIYAGTDHKVQYLNNFSGR